MSKINLIVDCDLTIMDSAKAFCDVYNNWYFTRSNFVPADYTEINKYDFSDQCPLLNGQEDIRKIFASYDFFKFVELMPNAYEVLYRLNSVANIIICSIGTPMNLCYKSKWLNEKLPFIHNYLLINNGENIMDKSIINMSGAIFIDDIIQNLNSSNADHKICFGKIYSWNNDLPDDYLRALNWLEAEEIINKLITQKGDFIYRTE